MHGSLTSQYHIKRRPRAQVRFGICTATDVTTDSAGAASVSITTMEDTTLEVQMSAAGVRVVEAADGGTTGPRCYDSLNSLLLNESAGFTSKFNGSLAAQLAAVAAERGHREDALCPVCGAEQPEPPPWLRGSALPPPCDCCGVEVGVSVAADDQEAMSRWRERWIANGCIWADEEAKPPGWKPPLA